MKQPRAIRLRRLIRTVPHGAEVLDLVAHETQRLVDVSEQGIPAVSAISAALYERFPKAVRSVPFRQFVGIAVTAALEEQGFKIEKAGVRLRGDPVFITGSVFRKTATAPLQPDPSLLARLISVMTPSEKDELLRLLTTSEG